MIRLILFKRGGIVELLRKLSQDSHARSARHRLVFGWSEVTHIDGNLSQTPSEAWSVSERWEVGATGG